MACQYPGCNRPVFTGSSYCSKTHRDNSQTQGAGTTCLYAGCTKSAFPGGNFCSKAHRDNPPSSASPGGKTCHLAGCTKPVFPGSNYCSKTHRNNAPSAPATHAGKTCRYAGCTKPVFPGGDFCSKFHRDHCSQPGSINAPASNASATTGGKTCRHGGCTKPVFSGSDFCSKAHRDAAGAGMISINSELHEIPSTDSKFSDVENQFKQKWLHSTTGKPNVNRIYRISLPSNLVAKYTNYRQQVESRGSFTSRHHSAGNECRRFHGTNRECDLGDNGNTNFCSSSSCSVCSIIKTSYRLNFAGSNKPWSSHGGGRLGNGIYTSATSSKSNDYSRNVNITSPYKAMFLNKVVVGNPKKLTKDDPSLTAPPPGYDSIIGEPGAASSLNYDELVVYDESAIIPAYLIIYDG